MTNTTTQATVSKLIAFCETLPALGTDMRVSLDLLLGELDRNVNRDANELFRVEGALAEAQGLAADRYQELGRAQSALTHLDSEMIMLRHKCGNLEIKMNSYESKIGRKLYDAARDMVMTRTDIDFGEVADEERDRIIDHVIEQMTLDESHECFEIERDFDVTVTLSVTVTQSIKAKSLKAAREAADYAVESEELVRSGYGWEISDTDVDNIEVEFGY